MQKHLLSIKDWLHEEYRLNHIDTTLIGNILVYANNIDDLEEQQKFLLEILTFELEVESLINEVYKSLKEK